MRCAARSGRPRFRRLGAADRGVRLAHLVRLGGAARRARFLGDGRPGCPPEPTLAIGCWIDGTLRGLAELWELPGRPSAAEVALSVEPPHQGRGHGTVLLERLLVLARNRGLCRLLTLCEQTNGRLIAVLRRSGARITAEQGEARAVLDLLPATPATLALERLEQWETVTDHAAAAVRAWIARAPPGAGGPPLAGDARG